MIRRKNKQRGVIAILILIIVALFILKYGADITFEEIFGNKIATNLWSILVNLWNLIWKITLISLEYIGKFLSNILNYLQGVEVK